MSQKHFYFRHHTTNVLHTSVEVRFGCVSRRAQNQRVYSRHKITNCDVSGASQNTRLGSSADAAGKPRNDNEKFSFISARLICAFAASPRVAKGGHHVSDADVRRRFERSNKNFWRIYKEAGDDWFLTSNAGDSFKQVANGDADGAVIFDEIRFEKWLKNKEIKERNGTVKDETLRKSIELGRIGNAAVYKAQEENRRLGIPNWCEINGRIVGDQ